MADSASFWRDPALPWVESRRACDSQACYRPHSHPSFSIGSVDRGHSLFTGSPEGPVALAPGTLVFVPAHRVHACNPLPDKAWSYQMLHLDDAWLQEIRCEYGRDKAAAGLEAGADTRLASDVDVGLARKAPIAACASNPAPEPVRIVVDPLAYADFCRLNDLLFSSATPADKEAALIQFIGEYDQAQGLCIDAPRLACGSASHAAAVLAARLAPVMEALQRSLADDIALSALAALAGMSRFQLIRAFRAVTGTTPHAWQLNQRINLAREGILAGEAIASLAYRLGFADQAHFQRVFKAHAAVTPGRFRA